MPDFLEGAYGATLRVSGIGGASRGGGSLLIHSRTDVGPFKIDDAQLPGDFAASPDPVNKVVGVWVTRGTVACDCDGMAGDATAGDVTLPAQHDLPFYAEHQGLHETVVLLEPSLVAGVAAGLPAGHAPLPIRFSSFGAVDAASAQRWKDTVSYVKDVVLSNDVLATPLVLGHTSRLLAAVTLSTFPNRAVADPTPHDRNDHHPVLLRRAMEFVEANVTQDIGIVDIADSLRVTPRAVQRMFRRHLDTTPLQYLRQVRLHYAHQDLVVAEPGQETVAAIAAHWGFTHTGRFAVLYRQSYGRSPHTTLRGSAQSDDMAELLRTLWAYRGLGGDHTRAAAALTINRSTVRYRLYRIRELTGLDPLDPRAVDALRDISNQHPGH
ncbi:MAG: AraC family transcriptional regulator [Mycobacterium sp.]|nr:AraC family transcriptional regulator [Mycobacterium sp.]